MKTLILFLSACAFNVYASGITYQGRIFKPDGAALESSSVEFRLQVRSPGSENCVLFEETRVVNMAGSGGVFNITLNDGNGTRVDAPTYTLDQAFANRGVFTLPGGQCASGTTYTPAVKDNRKLIVYFKDEGASQYEPLPILTLNYVPSAMYALESQKVDQFGASSLLRAVDGSGNPATVSALTPAQITEFLAIVNGTSTSYVSRAPASAMSLPSYTSAAPPGTPSEGSLWYDSTDKVMKFYNGTSNVPVASSGSIAASAIASGTIDTARLGSGTANTTTFLRGDSTWTTVSGSKWTSSSSDIYFNTGNVGIGTASPASALDVYGGAKITTGGLNLTSTGMTNAGSITGVGANLTGSSAMTIASGGTAQNLNLRSSTTGMVTVGTGNGTQLGVIDNGATVTDYVTVKGSNATKSPTIGVGGSSTWSNLILQPKGASAAVMVLASGTAEPASANSATYSSYFSVYGPSQGFSIGGGANISASSTDTQQAGRGGTIGFGGQDGAIQERLFGVIGGFKENSTSSDYSGYLAFGSRPNGGGLTERMRISSTGNVGVGTTTPNSQLHVRKSVTTAGTAYAQTSELHRASAAPVEPNTLAGIRGFVANQSSNDVTGSLIGGLFFSSTGSTSAIVNNLYGMQGIATKTGSSTVTTAVGLDGLVEDISLTGTVMSSAIGIRANVTTTNIGGNLPTITNAYGISSSISRPVGTITNAYGIYTGTIEGTNKWSIFANDATAPSYFAGNVGIGTTTPGEKLEVSGNIKASGQIVGGVSADADSTVSFATSSIIRTTAVGACGTLAVSGTTSGGVFTLTMPSVTATCTLPATVDGLSVKAPSGYTSGITVTGVVYSFINDGTNVWVSYVPF